MINIKLNNFSFQYIESTKPALSNVTLEIKNNSYTAILGPNGSGKTTLLKIISGLLNNSGMSQIKSGEVTINNESFFSKNTTWLAQNICYIPTHITTNSNFSVLDYVVQSRYAFEPFYKKPSRHANELSKFNIAKLKIENISDKPISKISTGQLQLVLLARALTQDPKIFLIDEGTSNLDIKYQLIIFEILKQLHDAGKTISIVLHDLNLASEFCPLLTWMNSGSVIASGETKSLFNTELIQKIYDTTKVQVGINPATQKPKLFYI